MELEPPMRMLERMIKAAEIADNQVRNGYTWKHLHDLTLLRDKFQQAGKDMLDHRQRVVEATVSGRPCEDRQKGLVLGIDRSLRAFGFAEAESVTGSKGCNTSEALNPSLSAVRGLKPAKDRRKLGTKEKP